MKMQGNPEHHDPAHHVIHEYSLGCEPNKKPDYNPSCKECNRDECWPLPGEQEIVITKDNENGGWIKEAEDLLKVNDADGTEMEVQ